MQAALKNRTEVIVKHRTKPDGGDFTKKPAARMRKELQKMLVLGRNIGDTIVINDNIYITIFETSTVGNKFKIAIDAPADAKISRGEHYADDAERWAKIQAMKEESVRRSRRVMNAERQKEAKKHKAENRTPVQMSAAQ